VKTCKNCKYACQFDGKELYEKYKNDECPLWRGGG
jgi:hypothetical protein